MDRFRKVFRHRHVVLPVIHVTSLEQAQRNAQISLDEGADGVFLINHGFNHQGLVEIYSRLIVKFPGFWIGVNCLDLRPEDVFKRVPLGMDGVWVDNAMIDETGQDQPEAQAVLDVQNSAAWKGLYFGGVAFKYQRHVSDLGASARSAAPFMDVVTTSGSGTGRAASPQKIEAMKKAIPNHPLAIASGITPENVHNYLPFADCFLVATGISRTFEDLDPAKVRSLIVAVRSFEES